MNENCIHSFIGDGYAHNIMDGEALALVGSGSLTREVIVLSGEALAEQDGNKERSDAHMIELEQDEEIGPCLGVENLSDQAPEMQSIQMVQPPSQCSQLQDGLEGRHGKVSRPCYGYIEWHSSSIADSLGHRCYSILEQDSEHFLSPRTIFCDDQSVPWE
jgi:hypothetical protein